MWFLFACSPAQLDVRLPEGVHHRLVEAEVRADQAVHWSLDGVEQPTLEPGTATLDLAQAPHGTHTVRFWTANLLGQQTVSEHVLELDHAAPVVEIAAASLLVEQGHTLSVHLRSNEPVESITLSVLGQDRPLYPTSKGWQALIGVPIRTPAGPTPLTVAVADTVGNSTEWTHLVQVEAVEWPFTGKLPLSKSKASVPSDAILQMRNERDPVYAERVADRAFGGPMQLPLEGRHTSSFGTFREYPDGKRSHHDAEDISRKPRTPIRAAANGTVALAKMQAVHGNAILLQHGRGVVSLYSHQAELLVQPGEKVKRGQTIGLLGSTGRSTGPHLHWGVVVDNVPVDPMQWVTDDFSTVPDYFVAMHP